MFLSLTLSVCKLSDFLFSQRISKCCLTKQSLVYALVKLFTLICNSLNPCYSFFGYYFYTTYKERLKSTLFSFEKEE